VTPPRTAGVHGLPRKVLVDPHTAELVQLIVEVRIQCAFCGEQHRLEYWDDLGRLVRVAGEKQPCWHYRANQANTQGELFDREGKSTS